VFVPVHPIQGNAQGGGNFGGGQHGYFPSDIAYFFADAKGEGTGGKDSRRLFSKTAGCSLSFCLIIVLLLYY
jgi:hypothetical protein